MQNKPTLSSRRQFLQQSGHFAAASLAAAAVIPHVHAAENNTIRLALVGCGGRGSGAAQDALATTSGPIKLVAMADVFPDRMKTSYESLAAEFAAAGGCSGRSPFHWV